MSRIYEALQRADLEQKASHHVETMRVVEPVTIPVFEEAAPPPSQPTEIEQVAAHPWALSATSFPTLEDRGAGVEQFRSLRSRIYQFRYEAPLKTILVSSGMPSEGKSFVTANLAMSLARNSVNNILLIDADLRRPTLHHLLGAPNVPGLSEYLAGTSDFHEILQRDQNASTTGRVSNLTFIASGKCGDNSSELLANHRIEDLISAASPHFDWILIDSPPVLAVTDAVDIARAADAVLLVAREANTPFDVAQRTQAAFAKSRILGFVLNASKDAGKSGSYNYYYGNTESAPHPTPGKDKRRKG